MDYAIFRTGGKQYRVSPRDVIDVEKLPVEAGSQIELGNVLAISRDGDLVLGRPLIVGARVVADIQAQTRDRKIIVFKYKRKVRYRVKRGHRQHYTRLAIREFLLEGEEASSAGGGVPAAVAVLDQVEEIQEDEVEEVLVADDVEAEEAEDQLEIEPEDEAEEAASDEGEAAPEEVTDKEERPGQAGGQEGAT